MILLKPLKVASLIAVTWLSHSVLLSVPSAYLQSNWLLWNFLRILRILLFDHPSGRSSRHPRHHSTRPWCYCMCCSWHCIGFHHCCHPILMDGELSFLSSRYDVVC